MPTLATVDRSDIRGQAGPLEAQMGVSSVCPEAKPIQAKDEAIRTGIEEFWSSATIFANLVSAVTSSASE